MVEGADGDEKRNRLVFGEPDTSKTEPKSRTYTGSQTSLPYLFRLPKAVTLFYHIFIKYCKPWPTV